MIQAPLRLHSKDNLLSTQLLQLQNSEAYANQNQLNVSNSNDVSTSLQSILFQLQTQLPTQNRSKNLEELLHMSSSSMPSNSVFQSSFNSAMPSPFVGHNTPSSYLQQLSMGSELSRGFNSNLLGTPLQNPHLFGNKQAQNPQSNEAMQAMLISQLADLLKQESEKKIKSAIVELLLKYKHLGILSDKILGKDMAGLEELVSNTPKTNPIMQQPVENNFLQANFNQNHPQFQQNTQYQPQFNQQRNIQQLGGHHNMQGPMTDFIPHQTVPLTGGLYMNSFPRQEEPKISGLGLFDKNIPSTKVEAARRGLFGMEPHSNERRIPLAPSFAESTRTQNLLSIDSLSSTLQPPQPVNTNQISNLDRQFGLLHIDNLDLQSNHIDPKMSFKDQYGANVEHLKDLLLDIADYHNSSVGTYTNAERIDKILKYKGKIRKHRSDHPVNRTFKGRSMVAGKKPRIKGKFVKMEEYLKSRVKEDYEDGRLNWTEPLMDDVNESTTYNDSEKSLREHRDMQLKEEAF